MRQLKMKPNVNKNFVAGLLLFSNHASCTFLVASGFSAPRPQTFDPKQALQTTITCSFRPLLLKSKTLSAREKSAWSQQSKILQDQLYTTSLLLCRAYVSELLAKKLGTLTQESLADSHIAQTHWRKGVRRGGLGCCSFTGNHSQLPAGSQNQTLVT